MSYTVKIPVELISQTQRVTHQFTIVDDGGVEFTLRKWEDSAIDEGGYYILKGDKWVDFIPEEEMEDWIDEELGGDFY